MRKKQIVKNNGPSSFEDCLDLIEISIPNTVKELGEKVFKDCYEHEKIEFETPSCLTIIGSSCFEKCKKFHYLLHSLN